MIAPTPVRCVACRSLPCRCKVRPETPSDLEPLHVSVERWLRKQSEQAVTVPCLCGGRLTAVPPDEWHIRDVVEGHRRTRKHREWAARQDYIDCGQGVDTEG